MSGPRLSTDPDAAMMRGEANSAEWDGERFIPRGCVLGIDPGLTVGWAFYHPNAAIMVCGEIDLRPLQDLGERLAELRDSLDHMLAARRPSLLAIERPFGRGAFTSETPGVICALTHMVAFDHQIPRREYTASAIKKAIAGSGKASKRDVMQAVAERYGFAPQNDHQGDAAAVAVLAWARAHQ
jgi:crossover junction endodeoxyribonuclease RuvC